MSSLRNEKQLEGANDCSRNVRSNILCEELGLLRSEVRFICTLECSWDNKQKQIFSFLGALNKNLKAVGHRPWLLHSFQKIFDISWLTEWTSESVTNWLTDGVHCTTLHICGELDSINAMQQRWMQQRKMQQRKMQQRNMHHTEVQCPHCRVYPCNF